jgi:hypothetical protein
MKHFVLAFAFALCFAYVRTNGQTSTYEQVHAIFQAHCTGSCHGSTNPQGNLDLSGTTSEVYNRLVDATPTNPAAVASGYKRVIPGYPYRSFLMKKVNHGLDPMNELVAGEGATMPNTYADSLSKEQIETIRQWIIWGAKDTGVTYNLNLVHDFYTNGGIAETTAPLTPAQEGREGYQVKFGPVFLQPLGEFEFFQPYNPNLAAPVEITELHSTLPPQCHHWVLRTITPAGVTAMGVAPRNGTDFTTQINVFTYAKFMGIWQYSDDLNFPAGTAHYQDSAEALLLNLHMHNYSGSQILAASAYTNVYTQPRGSGAIQMKSDLSSYGGQNPFLLNIPATGQPVVFTNEYTVPGEMRYYWNIQSHTHARGKDFDMFLRNSDGTKGQQIYEGFYNEDYSFNQGYYDYSHPAVKIFDPLLPVDMTNGLIFEATYQNNGSVAVPFGLTTEGEMFVTYFQFTNELPTAINDVKADNSNLQVFPNPTRNIINLSYATENNDLVSVELYNEMGTKVKSMFNGNQVTGKHTMHIDAVADGLAAGMYFVHLEINGSKTVRKVIIMN